MRSRARLLVLSAFAAVLCGAATAVVASRTSTAAAKVIAALDLAKPFGTKSEWRFSAVQGPPGKENELSDGPVPGLITLCLKRASDAACSPALRSMAQPPSSDYAIAWQSHYLRDARLVYPHGRNAPPLLLVQTGSTYSTDGNQLRYTQLLAYRPAGDRFDAIFTHATGRNNNEEVRFIDSAPLAGSMIVAEPTDNAPFGYWVTISRLGRDYRYRQVLRYRSATRYLDRNPLPVIDSEMPAIQQRLGFWRPGQPLPLPTRRCAKPRLIKKELWCS